MFNSDSYTYADDGVYNSPRQEHSRALSEGHAVSFQKLSISETASKGTSYS